MGGTRDITVKKRKKEKGYTITPASSARTSTELDPTNSSSLACHLHSKSPHKLE